MKWSPRSPVVLSALGAGLLCVPIVLAGHATPVAADDRPSSKIERQIRVVERIIDQMLIDSPNFLVQNHEPTTGFEIEADGIVFTFRASLTGPGWGSGRFSGLLPWNWRDRHSVIILDEGEEDDETVVVDNGLIVKDGDVYYIGKGGKLKKTDDEWEVIDQKTYRERQAKKYERAKEELIEVLMDAGEVLTALPAGQEVRIDCRLNDVELPEDREISKLSVRAGMDDLRSHADGRLSDEEMKARVEVRES